LPTRFNVLKRPLSSSNFARLASEVFEQPAYE
jgi:hypothetical protein